MNQKELPCSHVIGSLFFPGYQILKLDTSRLVNLTSFFGELTTPFFRLTITFSHALLCPGGLPNDLIAPRLLDYNTHNLFIVVIVICLMSGFPYRLSAS